MRSLFYAATSSIASCVLLGSIVHGIDDIPASVPATTAKSTSDSAIDATPATWQSLAIYPPAIKLSAKADSQHVIAVATRSDGITQDVTEQTEWKIANSDLAQIENTVLSPKADGNSQITAKWKGLSANAESV